MRGLPVHEAVTVACVACHHEVHAGRCTGARFLADLRVLVTCPCGSAEEAP